MLLQAGMTLGQRSPQLMMGMLWTQKVSCGGVGGNCEGLRVLVLLQTDLEQSSRSGVAGHRGGPCSGRGQFGDWHISFSRSRFGMLVSRLAPLPDHTGNRQSQGCKIMQTSSAGHTAAKGAGARGWGREAPKEEIP